MEPIKQGKLLACPCFLLCNNS